MKRVLSVVLLVFILAGILSGCGFGVPRPEIKKGEFNFSVTYEFDGEVKEISGVYVCEFDGINWALDGGYHRVWKGYVKDNTTEEFILLATADNGGEIELNLFFDPDCFMGDSNWSGDEPFTPILTVKVVDGNGLYFENDANLIAENYGVRIISYDYDEPIENTFN